ncbi:hypothetical protein ES703_16983 [subsurface metagenome]
MPEDNEITIYKRGEIAQIPITPPVPKRIDPQMLQIIMLDDLKVAASRVANILTPTTRFVDLARSSLGPARVLTVLEEYGAGQLEQFHVRSPNTDFEILIAVDMRSFFEKTYDEIREIQQNSPELSAFAELDENGDPTGHYIASIRNIPYENSIWVRVENTGSAPVTFSQLFAKYTIKE